MKVLFLHPKDDPQSGPWAQQKWDRIVDLGFAGPETYGRWSELFQCEVESIGFPHTDICVAREAQAAASGYLLDRHGIDWWGVISVRYTQHLVLGVAMGKIASTFDDDSELFVSRVDFHWRLLEAIIRRKISSFVKAPTSLARLFETLRKVRRLSYSQAKQVISDKFDPEYRMRRHISSHKAFSGQGAVLLPSAYVNVLRMAVAYAETMPQTQFLLVNARGGPCEWLPLNVRQTELASYMPSKDVSREYEDLRSRWKLLRHRLESNLLLAALMNAGVLDSFENELHQWLSIRDAWSEVYERERITGVFCCDDSNPYTRLPLLLGKRRGLPTYVSHHGALDGQNLLRNTEADVVFAKGYMERDYLVRRCGLPDDAVEIGAPIRYFDSRERRNGGTIVFFSEDYEVSGGRVEEFYRDVLPPLAGMATEAQKKLVLKLHPAESLRDRRRLVQSILTRKQQEMVQIVDGPLDDNLWHSMWFGVTVISTTATECALRRIPVFLCQWLENWPYKYAEQFARFGVGFSLGSPTEIARIPALLKTFAPGDPSHLWQAAPDRLRALFCADGFSSLPAAL